MTSDWTIIDKITLEQAIDLRYIVGGINKLIDAVNNLQELARSAESSLAVDTKSIDSLSLQVSQHQEAIDDMHNTIAKLNQYESDNSVCRWKTKVLRKTIDDMLQDNTLPDHVADTGKMVLTVDNQVARTDAYVDTIDNSAIKETIHKITWCVHWKLPDTEPDKILYSKEKVEQEAEELMRENDAYRAGIKFAVERIKELAWQDWDVSREKQI